MSNDIMFPASKNFTQVIGKTHERSSDKDRYLALMSRFGIDTSNALTVSKVVMKDSITEPGESVVILEPIKCGLVAGYQGSKLVALFDESDRFMNFIIVSE